MTDATSSALIPPPLVGVRIIEIAGIGPGPFCGMMLADHGAEVIRIDRPGGVQAGMEVDGGKDVLLRSRRTITLDLKTSEGATIVRKLAQTADGLIEGFRPGVMERLGLGPDRMLADNPRLVYGRMTGWGQSGPYASRPGHDINYIALTGALAAIGRKGDKPLPPLNLVGDFGGGGLLLAYGMLAAILSARMTGRGRVVDCAMSEGASLLMAGIWSLKANDMWRHGRGENVLDSGAPFYDSYETADGGHIAIGAIEPKFYKSLLSFLGLQDDPDFTDQMNVASWAAARNKLTRLFRQRTRAEWCSLLEGEDVCFAPVMTMEEAASHPHNIFRESFETVDDVVQPVAAPRYHDTSRVKAEMWRPDNAAAELMAELGYDEAQFSELRRRGVVAS